MGRDSRQAREFLHAVIVEKLEAAKFVSYALHTQLLAPR